MRRYQRLWRRKARMRCLGVRLDDRREIRAGIGEQVFDTALREQRQIGLRDALGLEFLPRHPALLLFRLSLAEHSAEGCGKKPDRRLRDATRIQRGTERLVYRWRER